MKKFLSIFLVLVTLLSVAIPASATSVDENSYEIELTLDSNGRAGVTYGYVVFEDSVRYYNFEVDAEKAAFESIQTNSNSRAVQPRSIGSFHVGIEMVGTQYRMYYEVKGVGLLSVGGYMKCKSTAWLFAKTYHDQKFSQTSIGTTMMSGESSVFSLPSGTEKVKVGWHDVTIRDGDGYAELADAYAKVNVG